MKPRKREVQCGKAEKGTTERENNPSSSIKTHLVLMSAGRLQNMLSGETKTSGIYKTKLNYKNCTAGNIPALAKKKDG